MNSSEHVYAVIMAGGSGTRFWPASRAARPKQLLNLGGGDESLLAATARRIASLVAPERVVVVTSERLESAVREALPAALVLAEPYARNTAPAVTWAAHAVHRRDPEAVCVVLAADHHVRDEAAFLRVLQAAIAHARGGEVVTLGITPTRPETGYGWIQTGEPLSDGAHLVRRFVEKPDLEIAKQYLASGDFLWNSGSFVFRADVILRHIEALLPGLREAFHDVDQAAGRGEEVEALYSVFGAMRSVSIDVGVMEKLARIVVLPGDFGWSDVGSWTTAWELADKDARGNAAPQDAVLVDTDGAYVSAPAGKVVALVGVRDLVVVDTGDALLVMPRSRAQDVKAVVDALRQKTREELL